MRVALSQSCHPSTRWPSLGYNQAAESYAIAVCIWLLLYELIACPQVILNTQSITGYPGFNNPLGKACCTTGTTCAAVGVACLVCLEGSGVVCNETVFVSLLHATTSSSMLTISNCPY